jgi:hypothetical protein
MKPKLTKREASAYLRDKHGLIVAPRTLDNKAWSGCGPRFYKAGLRRFYAPDDLDDYAIAELGQPRTSTSEITRPRTIAE